MVSRAETNWHRAVASPEVAGLQVMCLRILEPAVSLVPNGEGAAIWPAGGRGGSGAEN